jgi:filamentous hemagglutinin
VHWLEIGFLTSTQSTARRVGLDKETQAILVLDETTPGIFRGHVRSWEQLRPEMQNALRKAGLVDRRDNIIE